MQIRKKPMKKVVGKNKTNYKNYNVTTYKNKFAYLIKPDDGSLYSLTVLCSQKLFNVYIDNCK
jgi:hypothetical protein